MKRDEKSRWYEFFVSEHEKLLNYVRGRIRRISDMDAEDIVGEVMLNIVSKMDTSGPVENIAAYANRSISNRIVDYKSRKSRTVSLDGLVDEEGEIPLIALLSDHAEDVCGKEEKRELLLRLTEAIGKLEPRQRAVLIATEVRGKTFRELSEEWHEPVGTLLSRKCRAIKALRGMLNDLDE
ncbi:MAG TPA: RNA polymerase sigma factor [Clostridia bacterium]|nr:RNA polymerase sigma factor [Clostridia bacterium]